MESKLEILDTGMEDIDGGVVYDRASTSWVNLHAYSLTPEFDFITSNDSGKRYNTAKTRYSQVSNRIESMNPIRFTVQCFFDTEDATDLGTLIDLGTTLGLKKIRGGLAILSNIPNNSSGEVYVIIKSFRFNENLKNSNNKTSCTITLEAV